MDPTANTKEQHILKLALRGEESVNVELKTKYDLTTDKTELLRDIIALCNPMSQDGAENIAYLIIGCKNGKIFDVSQLNLDESDLRAIIHAYVFPQVNFTFHTVEYIGSKIIGIEIVRTEDLYVAQKRLVTRKKKKAQGEEQEDILSAGECWVRQGTAKKQLDGQQIIAYQHQFFKKKIDGQFFPILERIEQLEAKILSIQDTRPNIGLCFNNGDVKTSIQVTRNFRKKEDWIEEKLEYLKQRYPKLEPVNSNLSSKDSFDSVMAIFRDMSDLRTTPRLTSEDIEEYNSELDKYYDKLYIHAEECYIYILNRRSTAPVTIRIVNSGKCPATDIDIELSVSPECRQQYMIKSGRTLKADEPVEPAPPLHPMSRKRALMAYPSVAVPSLSNLIKNVAIQNRKASSKKIRITNGSLQCKIDKLKHGHELDISFALSLSESGDSAICKLNYRLTAGNMSEGLSGILHVVNEKQV